MTRYLGFAVVACGVLCCQAQPSRTPTRLEAEYYVAVYAQHYGVPIAFVRAIVQQESGWHRCAISHKGAVGLMQLMPSTAARLGVRDRCNVNENVSGGVLYLASLMHRFQGDLRLVAAGYIAGVGLAYSSCTYCLSFTTLLSTSTQLSKILENWKDVPPTLLQQIDWRDSLYGYIGMEDRTLDPIIRPGSFVQIDSRQRIIPPVNWHDDFDRPIFFFELRDRYVCSWCELYGSQLILVPTAHSHRHARRIRYPGDVTIVGRVTGVAMRIAEARETPTKTSPLS